MEGDNASTSLSFVTCEPPGPASPPQYSVQFGGSPKIEREDPPPPPTPPHLVQAFLQLVPVPSSPLGKPRFTQRKRPLAFPSSFPRTRPPPFLRDLFLGPPRFTPLPYVHNRILDPLNDVCDKIGDPPFGSASLLYKSNPSFAEVNPAP